MDCSIQLSFIEIKIICLVNNPLTRLVRDTNEEAYSPSPFVHNSSVHTKIKNLKTKTLSDLNVWIFILRKKIRSVMVLRLMIVFRSYLLTFQAFFTDLCVVSSYFTLSLHVNPALTLQ